MRPVPARTIGTFILLNQLEPSIGWRIAFLIGPVLGIVILFLRRHLPESPRWQVTNGREDEAEETIAFIEQEVESTARTLPALDGSKAIDLTPTDDMGYLTLTTLLFEEMPERAIYGAMLMITQSFLYNAIFLTYVLSGLLLAVTAFLFDAGVLNAVTQTIAWGVIFFASAGASSAYLTMSEIFPLEDLATPLAARRHPGTRAEGSARPSC